MGGLAEKVEEEHLILAAGKRVYALVDNKLECIATRKGRITGLTVYNGKLIDSGNYSGVYDTIANSRMMLPNFQFSTKSWRDLATCKGSLIGTPMKQFEGAYWDSSLFDLTKGEEFRRFGSTEEGNVKHLSSNGEELAEAGFYTEMIRGEIIDYYGPNDDTPIYGYYYDTSEEVKMGSGSYTSSLRIKDIWGSVRSLEAVGRGSCLVADNKRIRLIGGDNKLIFQLEHETTKIIEELESLVGIDYSPFNPYSENLAGHFSSRYSRNKNTLSNLLSNFYNQSQRGHVSHNHKQLGEKLWKQYTKLVNGNKDMFQKNIQKLVSESSLEKVISTTNRRKLTDFEDDGSFGPVPEKRLYSGILHRNAHIVRDKIINSFNSIFGRYKKVNTLKAIATVNSSLYFGTSQREIHRVISPEESQVIAKSPGPIAKMIAVPDEVYDGGIAKEVSRRRQLRAAHAKGKKIILLRAA